MTQWHNENDQIYIDKAVEVHNALFPPPPKKKSTEKPKGKTS